MCKMYPFSGHNAYLGVLYIQRMLNNPIVLAFTEILSDEARENVLDEYGHRKPFNGKLILVKWTS